MEQTRLIMGMPITITCVDTQVKSADFEAAFDYFLDIDRQFSPYKQTSELSHINAGIVPLRHASTAMKTVLNLCEQARIKTNGYFEYRIGRSIDPTGLVKGWAIFHCAKLLQKRGLKNFAINAGGDIQTIGHGPHGRSWRFGIRNPFNRHEVVDVVKLLPNQALATSGNYIRGAHVYNPHAPKQPLNQIASVSIIAADIIEADVWATAAFAMQERGIECAATKRGISGYAISYDSRAKFTYNWPSVAVRTP